MVCFASYGTTCQYVSHWANFEVHRGRQQAGCEHTGLPITVSMERLGWLQANPKRLSEPLLLITFRKTPGLSLVHAGAPEKLDSYW